jgi:hypothetical protein
VHITVCKTNVLENRNGEERERKKRKCGERFCMAGFGLKRICAHPKNGFQQYNQLEIFNLTAENFKYKSLLLGFFSASVCRICKR